MTLKHIALRNLMRRKAKSAFVLAGLAIGIATVVAVISFVEAMTGDINHKLEKYGANILIMDLLRQLNDSGMTIVIVTHSPECAAFAGRVLQISDGLLVSDS